MAQLIHISIQRFKFIQSLGYQLEVEPSAMWHGTQGDTTFHLLFTEHAHCLSCNGWFWSVDANSPAELETIKIALEFKRKPEDIVEILAKVRQALLLWQKEQIDAMPVPTARGEE